MLLLIINILSDGIQMTFTYANWLSTRMEETAMSIVIAVFEFFAVFAVFAVGFNRRKE